MSRKHVNPFEYQLIIATTYKIDKFNGVSLLSDKLIAVKQKLSGIMLSDAVYGFATKSINNLA